LISGCQVHFHIGEKEWHYNLPQDVDKIKEDIYENFEESDSAETGGDSDSPIPEWIPNVFHHSRKDMWRTGAFI